MITGMPRIAIAVRDMDQAVRRFHDTFGMPVSESPGAVDSLGVRIAMCTPRTGSNIELMSPAVPEAPLHQSLARFLDRRGEGLFALMLEAPDPNAEAEVLAGRGLHVLPLMPGAGGRDVHPRSTHGVLIRVYPTREHADGPPAGLTGIVRVIIAVNDFDDAVQVYRDRFAMALDLAPPDAERGVRAASCRPGTGGEIEIVTAVDTSRPFARSIAQFIERRGEGMYALVHHADDPAAVAAALRAKGVEVQAAADTPAVMEIQPASTFGALLRVEPRGAARPSAGLAARAAGS
jgi:catechol 2,3-dioxygenase-like lactoylglutathione lyase family enzyme